MNDGCPKLLTVSVFRQKPPGQRNIISLFKDYIRDWATRKLRTCLRERLAAGIPAKMIMGHVTVIRTSYSTVSFILRFTRIRSDQIISEEV